MKISRHAGVVLRLGFAVIFFFPARLTQGSDTEKYNVEKNDDAETYGGKAGAMLKPEEFIFSDRQQFAPTKRPLFVVGKDFKCYRGTFLRADNDDIKSLTLLDDGPEAMTKCIYQKAYSREPAGFSLFVEGGGVCRPTYANSLQELEKHSSTALKTTNKGVRIYHCTKDTVSYGEMLAQQKVEAVDKKREPAQKDAAVVVPTATATPSPTPEKVAPVPAVKWPPVPVSTPVVTTTPTAPSQVKVAATPVAAPVPPVSDDVPSIDFSPRKPIPVATAEVAPSLTATATPAPAMTPADTSTLTVKLRPVTKPEASPTSSPLPEKTGIEKYTVQILSSTDEEEAREHAQKAAPQPGFVIKAQVNGTTYFRVCVGRFETVHGAREFLTKNQGLFHSPEAFVQILPKK